MPGIPLPLLPQFRFAASCRGKSSCITRINITWYIVIIIAKYDVFVNAHCAVLPMKQYSRAFTERYISGIIRASINKRCLKCLLSN